MRKRKLKQIAKDWATGILLSCDTTPNEEGLLSEEEMDFIIEEVEKIALRISKNIEFGSFNEIVKHHVGNQ